MADLGAMEGEVLSFPIYPKDDQVGMIHAIFPDLAHLTEQDLAKPTSKTMQDIYLHCLDYLRYDVVGAMQRNMSQQERDNNYEGSCYLLYLKMAMQNVLGKLGVSDFRLNDLLQPNPKRTDRLLSAILNFVIYMPGCEMHVEQVSDNCILARDRQEEAAHNVGALIRRRGELEVARAEAMLHGRELEGQIDELKEEIQTMDWEKNTLDVEVSEMGKEKMNVEEAFSSFQSKMNRLQDELSTLRQQKVTSPERTLHQVKEMETEAEEKREVCRKKRVQLRQLHSEEEKLSLLLKDADNLAGPMANLKDYAAQLKIVQEELRVAKSETSTAKLAYADQEKRLSMAVSKAQLLKVQVAEASMEWSKRKKEQLHQIELKEAQSKRNKLQGIHAGMEEVQMLLKDMDLKEKERKNKSAQRMEECQKNMRIIAQECNEFARMVKAKIDAVNRKTKEGERELSQLDAEAEELYKSEDPEVMRRVDKLLSEAAKSKRQ